MFSPAFAVAKTPLGAYMSHLVATPGRRVYLVDANGKLIAASNTFSSGETLARADPGLADRARTHTSGSYSDGSRWFDAATIPGTPWRIVISVPTGALFADVNGRSVSLARIALIGLAIAGLMIIGRRDRRR